MGGKKQRLKPIDTNRVVRAIFATAESMGLSDRQMLEQLTSQVLERLELSQPLPGMEDLMQQRVSKRTHTLSDSEIQAMVKETLVKSKNTETTVSVTSRAKPSTQPGATSGLTENALTVLRKRYLAKNAEGEVTETPEDMFRRVARHVAAADRNYDPRADVAALEEQFHLLMTSHEFLPNSPTLMNAGRELGQLSACFVLPVDDSMESIFDAVKYTALIHKSGGGTGFSFSRLRPKKDRVGSTGGVASGPVSFMRAFDTATDVIKQGGMRRGANMAILRVDHPDILEFISAKENSRTLTNFNLSVAVDSTFMNAVKDGAEYDLTNPRDKKVVGRLNAKEVFDKVVDMAWRTGDPGIVFIDRINQDNPTPKLGTIEATNPCGEQPLLPYESCNLGSINLSRMLRQQNGQTEIDYHKLARTVHFAVHFLDNVIDVNKFPLPQIEHMTRLSRKIGLGVMGFADMLIQLKIPYNSDQAIAVAKDVMRFISEEATKASVELAKQRGVFPAFEGSIYDVQGGLRVRNAARTTIAPTGSLSIIAGCSSGIEPLFALSYTRNILEGTQLVEVNPYFEEAAKKEGFYSTELMQDLARGTRLSDEDGCIPDWAKEVFVTAHDITPEWHVRIQAAFQKHTDNAVSKTVNLPHDSTREDVARIYMMAYKEGLKGITIYRDRSKESQVLSLAPTVPETPAAERISPRKRPKVTTGVTERVTTGCGHLYVTVNSDENGICEVFTSLGKAGGCASAQLEAIGRLISLTLRSGVDVASVVKHLRGIRCPSISWEDGRAVLSCGDAIGAVLEKHLQGRTHGNAKNAEAAGPVQNWVGQCPECASMLVYQEGCYLCPSCGYTRC
ncbi:MAG: vitamin B12-dependent ribonucleotide reductase [Chloroflexota bacterium]